MGILSFFIKGDKSTLAILDTGEEFDIDFLDAESHEWNNEITRFPIETGSVISDSIIKRPRKYVLSGVTSDSPINLFEVAANIGAEPKTQQAVAFFESLADSQSLVTVTSKMKTYDSMGCTSVKIARNRSTGNSIKYDINFETVDIVDTAFGLLSDLTGAAKDAKGALQKTGPGAAAKDVGKKSAAAASPAAADAGATILGSWVGL